MQNAQCNWEKIRQKSNTKICQSVLGTKSAKLTEFIRAPGGLAVLPIRLGKGQTSQDFFTRFWDYKLPYKFGLSAFIFSIRGVKISTISNQEALSLTVVTGTLLKHKCSMSASDAIAVHLLFCS